ncbi:OsmC family protein [Beutenbergia cavernae DSM 12333]|uniref:OsmC family protein n=1 Tax=Beutenbergia cavernae (strain ATCC BAA-8 / DSM 12333 / CCUG 43141 / JCM 11478 / NBRC 16432 / NCIMB 13614 / HKI 0122) TaxID=471853 RepID=C5BV96_BEUC1|nr:OsmC family peroxiredoxin [Beutenbergia cavernae]ACQ80483.1 OsmC family protein [Beutenbergia cavernae DSM 12333]
MAPRIGRASWRGALREGSGTVTVGERAWTSPYSFGSRFADGPGTNPEELLATAHAGCFTMALTHVLEAAGVTPQEVSTSAHVALRMVSGTPTIARIDLSTAVVAEGLDGARLQELADTAKEGCAVSRALAGVAEITVTARLAAAVDPVGSEV